MMEMKTRLMVSLVLAAALISGCVGVRAPLRGGADDQTILLERARAYWEARYAQDMQRALSFEDPVRQKRLNLVSYIRLVGEPGRVYAVAVKGVTIQGDQADVEVEIHMRLAMPPWDKQVLKSVITDDWQKIDGVWYHVVDFHVIRAGKPRVFVDRGTIEYPPAELPAKAPGKAGAAASPATPAEQAVPAH